MSPRQKTHLTLSGIILAMGAFVGLMMALALLFYFLEPLLKK